jgi:hypothetical protein
MLVSGQLIQQVCEWNIDPRYSIRKWVFKHEVKNGDRVFMKLDQIPYFINIVSQLTNKVIAVIHNSDTSFTDDMLAAINPYVLKVYAVNCITDRAIRLQLGFRDHQYTSHHIIKKIADEPELPRTIKCLVNFLISTNKTLREPVFDMFKDKAFCTVQDYTQYSYPQSLDHSNTETMEKRAQFYRTLKQSKFALCPQGEGMDTHRVYECILFGVIPIVVSSPLDSIYSKLPVLIIQNWNEVTEEYLDKCTIIPSPKAITDLRIMY